MKLLQLFNIICIISILSASKVSAQQSSIAKEAEWLEQQLNLLSIKVKGQEGKDKFEFDECQCKYTYASNKQQGGFNMTKTNSFQLKEVSSVSYSKNEDNTYEMRIKLKTEDNSVTEVFDLSSVNVNLYAANEKQVKEVVNKFKQAVKTCSDQ